MNTCFRSSLTLLVLCTLACADDTPFLQTPFEIVDRTGTDKGLNAEKTPPSRSAPESREWAPRSLGSSHEEKSVVRFYSLNVVPNPGQLKPTASDELQHEVEADNSAIAGRVRVVSREMDDAPPARDLQTPFVKGIALVHRPLTIEGPIEVVSDAQESRREFGIHPVPVVPVLPVPVQLEGASDSDDVAEAIAGNQRPDSLKALSEIRLSASKPQGDPQDSSRPLDRALRLTEGRVGMLDMTPPPPRYFPQRNSYPIRHNPLYFEDPNLERCGLGHGCLTDAASLVRFAGRVPIMTYMMAVNPPHSCVRAKPDCPTCHAFGLDAYIPNPGELDVAAAALHAAVVVGVVFLIP